MGMVVHVGVVVGEEAIVCTYVGVVVGEEASVYICGSGGGGGG